MSHDVRFSSPTKAMRYAMRYNPRGVRLCLKTARKDRNWNLGCFQMAFAFAAIQGYPVLCFYNCMLAKKLAIATEPNTL